MHFTLCDGTYTKKHFERAKGIIKSVRTRRVVKLEAPRGRAQ